MPTLFLLDLETAADRATLCLRDHAGDELAHHEVVLGEHPLSLWAGLFDTRRHVKRLASVEAPATHLARLGVFLGEKVLGPAIAGRLAEGEHQRTVLVRLPAPEGDDLAAALARVPWELAIAPGDDRTLLDRHVVVRAVPAGATPAEERAILPEPGKPLRVLLVFAEAAGARPLAMRQERERLREMFFREVLPVRDVEIDVLCHGVTRRRLRDQVRDRGGYHVVHWSGHGHVSALEIALEEREDAQPWLEGEELLGLLSGESGLIPAVVFLSACHSGSLRNVKDWASFQAPLGDGDERAGTPAMEAMLRDRVGFTGAALALAQAGVKQVVAMRYEVGDRYARELGVRFYKRLLAGPGHPTLDAALAMARGELRAEERPGDYNAVDHATPLVLGREMVRIEPPARKSAQMARERPNPSQLLPHPNRELDPRDGFVGRGAELTALWRQWMEPGGAPIALIQGLAGMGKTALAAEAIHLWFERFDYVLCFQAKGQPLSIEEVYQRVDQRLRLGSSAYRERLLRNEMGAVHLEPGPMLKSADREEAQRENLVEVLGNERILLVVDNFETSLLSVAGTEGYAAQDPAWDRLFEVLGDRLHGVGSRALVTTRHNVAALVDPEKAVRVALGPLSVWEARLYFEAKPMLHRLLGGSVEERELARRIMDVSRGHPLILDRIGALARVHGEMTRDPTSAGLAALREALDRIQNEGYKVLADVFAGMSNAKEREQERRYLEEVALSAVDLLIGRLDADARWLLWVVTRASEPVPEDMLSSVLGKLPSSLLNELCFSGLLLREGDAYCFHELVAERTTAWMERQPAERCGRTDTDIWQAYGTWYGATFRVLVAAAKRDLASEAGRRGIRYLVRARAFEHLGAFAGQMVTGTRDPELLRQVVVDLQTAAGEVPAGKARWRLRGILADALNRTDRPDQALPLYAEAAEEAAATEHWSDLIWINGNWASALGTLGELDSAREKLLDSAKAGRRMGAPQIEIVGRELEALRVELKQDRAQEALPAIEAKLGDVRAWWDSWKQGKPPQEAPDREMLARTLVSALDIARSANLALERWQPCLDLVVEMEEIARACGASEHDLARTRLNRYRPQMGLGKLAEAKAVVEGCLDVFHGVEALADEAGAFSALSGVYDELRDAAQAIALERRALAIRDCLPDPRERAISHNNLARYLHAAGSTTEARAHQLAALVYGFFSHAVMRNSLHRLALRIRDSAARGETFAIPQLADLCGDPAFAALRAFIIERAVDIADLQSRIDAIVAEVRASQT